MKEQDILNAAQKWVIEFVDRYYYASGRNSWTYVETTYWYNAQSLERKEVSRIECISDGQEWKLPDWAKCITTRRKSLESPFY